MKKHASDNFDISYYCLHDLNSKHAPLHHLLLNNINVFFIGKNKRKNSAMPEWVARFAEEKKINILKGNDNTTGM